MSYEVLMYVIRDRNNVPIDLYFLCFTSPTLVSLSHDEEGKEKLVYFSEQRWMDIEEKNSDQLVDDMAAKQTKT